MGDYLLILIIQENRGEINREYYGGTEINFHDSLP